MKLTRRNALAAGISLPLFGILTRRADAAEFTYKLATGQAPTHPVNVQARAAADRIREATNGQVQINVFPAAQLGTDIQLISQVRLGAVQFINMASSVLATTVPAAGIVNVGFAFDNYDQVWRAMDGPIGKYITGKIAQSGMIAIGPSWNNGFRELTTSTKPVRHPGDLQNLKLRVPSAPLLTSLFKEFGAYPTPLDFSEVYTALQTHLVDGQENPLAIIDTAKLYEVQKYCTLTGHVWDGYWILGNPAAMHRLPRATQAIVLREFGTSALAERQATQALEQSLQRKMSGEGLSFINIDKAEFRAALAKTDFYPSWKAKFGDQPWGLLEQVSGSLG